MRDDTGACKSVGRVHNRTRARARQREAHSRYESRRRSIRTRSRHVISAAHSNRAALMSPIKSLFLRDPCRGIFAFSTGSHGSPARINPAGEANQFKPRRKLARKSIPHTGASAPARAAVRKRFVLPRARNRLSAYRRDVRVHGKNARDKLIIRVALLTAKESRARLTFQRATIELEYRRAHTVGFS